MNGHNHFTVPVRWKTADFEVAFGVGEFRKELEIKPDSGDPYLTIETRKQRESYSTTAVTHRSIDDTSSAPVLERDATWSDLSLRLPAKFQNKQWHVEVFDRSGKAIRPAGGWRQKDPIRNPGTWTASCKAEPKDIDRIVIATRGLEWVKFKGVRLYPNESKAGG